MFSSWKDGKVNSKKTDAIADAVWVGCVAMLAGFAALYFPTMALFRLGIPLTFWHSFLFLGASMATALIMAKGKEPWWGGWAIWGGVLIAVGVSVLVASPFHDFSCDGMSVRQGYVENLLQKNCPHAVPLSHLLSGWLGLIGGGIDSGKSIHALLILCAFGFCVRTAREIGLSGIWLWVTSLTISLNPVSVYQLSSFYIDGNAGSLLTCLCAIFILKYLNLERPWLWMLGAIVLFLLSTAKVSGLAYGVILAITLGGGVLFGRREISLRQRSLAVALLFFLVGLAGATCFLERGQGYTLNSITTRTSLTTPSYGIGPSSYAPDSMAHMNKGEAFLRSHFAPTATMTDEWHWKFPFWLNRRELALFEDLNSDPRSGGFGPLYGGIFILAFLAFLLGLFRMTAPWVVWVPALGILASCLLSQAWWARWVPQGWLVPMAFAVPVMTLRPMGLAGGLARASIAVALLNSILILAFYTSGCFQNQAALTRQLAFLKNMPQPLNVYIPSFHSNETWLKEAGLRFKKIDQEPSMPRLKLNRTNSKVQLPANWTNAPVSEQILQEWRKRDLLETEQPTKDSQPKPRRTHTPIINVPSP